MKYKVTLIPSAMVKREDGVHSVEADTFEWGSSGNVAFFKNEHKKAGSTSSIDRVTVAVFFNVSSIQRVSK